jgi:hypothetical protein
MCLLLSLSLSFSLSLPLSVLYTLKRRQPISFCTARLVGLSQFKSGRRAATKNIGNLSRLRERSEKSECTDDNNGKFKFCAAQKAPPILMRSEILPRTVTFAPVSQSVGRTAG